MLVHVSTPICCILTELRSQRSKGTQLGAKGWSMTKSGTRLHLMRNALEATPNAAPKFGSQPPCFQPIEPKLDLLRNAVEALPNAVGYFRGRFHSATPISEKNRPTAFCSGRLPNAAAPN